MNLRALVIFILASFFLHLSVNASESNLIQIDSELRTLHTRFVRDFVAPAQKKNLKQKLVLTKVERDAVIESLGRYKKAFDALEERAGNRFFRFGSTRKAVQERVVAKIMLNAHGAKLFSEVLSYPAVLGIVKEHKKVGDLPADYLHNLIMKLAKESQRSVRRGSHRTRIEATRPKMGDLLSSPKELSAWIARFKLSKEHKFLVPNLLEEYIAHIRRFSSKQKELMTYRIFSKYLYKFKVSTMTWLGDIALPDKNVFGKEYLDKMEGLLVPGDIGVINQDGRLSNLVFNGTWSHGLLYLGPYSQMDRIFSFDQGTNDVYESKCREEGLKCSNFVSYMWMKYPDSFRKYKKSSDTEKPLTVIEANSEGVVLSTSKYALAFNRIATFRPKLSLKDKAMAIEEAFRNYGKPYDFNFDNRTYGRIVCTELILHSYMPDDRIGKKGLDWFMTVISGAPAMYGFDIVETYFEMPKSQRKLDFLFYYESPRDADGVTEMNEEDLLKTVSPDMNRFKGSVHE